MKTIENTLTVVESFHPDLKTAKALVYDHSGVVLTNPRLNEESIVYGACSFELNGKTIQHRVSKITPTKTGQFVTLWKRNKDGITEPYHILDDLDFIIITSRSGINLGQFIFAKSVLAANEIITHNGREGKRGIRVYPPWDVVTSKQAEKTQAWQLNHFVSIVKNNSTDIELTRKLFLKLLQ